MELRLTLHVPVTATRCSISPDESGARWKELCIWLCLLVTKLEKSAALSDVKL